MVKDMRTRARFGRIQIISQQGAAYIEKGWRDAFFSSSSAVIAVPMGPHAFNRHRHN